MDIELKKARQREYQRKYREKKKIKRLTIYENIVVVKLDNLTNEKSNESNEISNEIKSNEGYDPQAPNFPSSFFKGGIESNEISNEIKSIEISNEIKSNEISNEIKSIEISNEISNEIKSNEGYDPQAPNFPSSKAFPRLIRGSGCPAKGGIESNESNEIISIKCLKELLKLNLISLKNNYSVDDMIHIVLYLQNKSKNMNKRDKISYWINELQNIE